MKQFQIYLKSELGKLGNHADAARFVRFISRTARETCGLPNSPDILAEVFSCQNKINVFVDSLNESAVRELTKSCDEDWRKNGMFRELSDHHTWSEDRVTVESVDVRKTDDQTFEFFKRHEFSLVRIAEAPELQSYEPYKSW